MKYLKNCGILLQEENLGKGIDQQKGKMGASIMRKQGLVL